LQEAAFLCYGNSASETTSRQPGANPMRYLHTMLRVSDLDRSLDFFCDKLGKQEVRRYDDPKGRYTNVFLAGSDDGSLLADSMRKGREPPVLELT
jgi:lactoylglutathione lyase